MNREQRRASREKRQIRTRAYTADASAIYRTMSRVQPFTERELLTLQTPVRVAFESMRSGSGEEADFHTLAGAVNVALIRSETIDPLCVETAQRAQASLMRILDRHRRIGRRGIDSQALQDIPPALDLYEQLLALSTPMQMQHAMQETLARMQAGEVFR